MKPTKDALRRALELHDRPCWCRLRRVGDTPGLDGLSQDGELQEKCRPGVEAIALAIDQAVEDAVRGMFEYQMHSPDMGGNHGWSLHRIADIRLPKLVHIRGRAPDAKIDEIVAAARAARDKEGT